MNQVIWLLINCNGTEEATNIGNTLLKQRLVCCFDVYKRHLAAFFWPPKTGKIETSKGAMSVLVTFKENYNSIIQKVKKLHSDDLPFIGYVEMKGVSKEYLNWMKGELKQ